MENNNKKLNIVTIILAVVGIFTVCVALYKHWVLATTYIDEEPYDFGYDPFEDEENKE